MKHEVTTHVFFSVLYQRIQEHRGLFLDFLCDSLRIIICKAFFFFMEIIFALETTKPKIIIMKAPSGDEAARVRNP